jgi:hypothetical protein
VEISSGVSEAEWLDHLACLVQLASGDPRAEVTLEPDLGVDGVTIPSAEWGSTPSHPFTIIRSSLSRPEQEGTALHEGAHWILGHVEDPAHRDRVMSAEQAPDEVAADEYALDVLLSKPEISRVLVGPLDAVRRSLLEDCRRHGGCLWHFAAALGTGPVSAP